MNKLKPIILISSLLMGTSLFGSQHQINSEKERGDDLEKFQLSSIEKIKKESNYLSFGIGLPSLISMNSGKRYQFNHHGVDCGIGFGGLPFLLNGILVQAYTNYLFYPKPRVQSQFYVGVGVKAVFFKSLQSSYYIAWIPSYLVFGQEWISKNGFMKFFQVDIGGIHIGIKNNARLNMFKPFLNFQLSYGVGY